MPTDNALAAHGAFQQSNMPLLDPQTFASVVAHAPLVAIDLIVEDMQGMVLLGLRNNPPAQGDWFVPGGRIRKGETLDKAFARIAQDELGLATERTQGQFAGVYEHFYDTNFRGTAGACTHYVVLAYRLQLAREQLNLPQEQHSQYRWMPPEQIAHSPDTHPHSQAYFQN